MISIENFYWMLFENLLKPSGLDCWYYYPFGSRDHLSMIGEFKTWQPRQEHHVLFHFDQEPIWTENLGKYDTLADPWSYKITKILANSEISEIKKQICKKRGMLDWYFFYHGFAALDWFRDSQYINLDCHPRKVFQSLNHRVVDLRAYRMALMARLLSQDLLHFGDVSFHATNNICKQELANPHSCLSDRDKALIEKNMIGRNCWPLVADSLSVNSDFSAWFGHLEYKLWQNSFVHLVNETVFYDAKLHLTEKIFKPIVSLRPFILAAAPGNLAYLRSYGFETFHHWWDESYDSEEDTDVRLDRIVEIIVKLCSRSKAELSQMHDEMRPVLEHNKTHFFGEFRRIIVDELVENFDSCLRIWNNGRIDRRDRPSHPDLQSVKEILLR